MYWGKMRRPVYTGYSKSELWGGALAALLMY